MSIDHRIDHAQRVIYATGHGVLTDDQVFGYQEDVCAKPDVRGYSELIDVTAVDKFALPAAERVRDLAATAAATDPPCTDSKIAIVASEDLAFGLGRMYQTLRELDRRSTKKVAVFRTREEALDWLGLGRTSLPD
jgi:hypothetical protein